LLKVINKLRISFSGRKSFLSDLNSLKNSQISNLSE